jgi:hypothetical protein
MASKEKARVDHVSRTACATGLSNRKSSFGNKAIIDNTDQIRPWQYYTPTI